MNWDPRRGRWAAVICLPTKRAIQIAQFDDERDAAMAYDRVALKLLGKHALRNFPEKRLSPTTLEEARLKARKLFKKRTSSQYRGVVWSERQGGWTAQISHRAQHFTLGVYDSEHEAARAYDRAAEKMHRNRAVLNFDNG